MAQPAEQVAAEPTGPSQWPLARRIRFHWTPPTEPEQPMPTRHPLEPPTRSTTALFGSLTAFLLLTACDDANRAVAPGGTPQFTMGSGTTPTLLGRATFDNPSGPPLDIKRITGDWHVQIKAKSGLDVAVQDIVFQPGGFSGWHTHPGPVFIQVISGTMRF